MTSAKQRKKKRNASAARGPQTFTKEQLQKKSDSALKRLAKTKTRTAEQLRLIESVREERRLMKMPAIGPTGQVVPAQYSRFVEDRAAHQVVTLNGKTVRSWDDRRRVTTVDVKLALPGKSRNEGFQEVLLDHFWVADALAKTKRYLVGYDTRFVIVGLEQVSKRTCNMKVLFMDRNLGTQTAVLSREQRLWATDGYPSRMLLQHNGSPAEIRITLAVQKGYPASRYSSPVEIAGISLPCAPIACGLQRLSAKYVTATSTHIWLLPSRRVDITCGVTWKVETDLKLKLTLKKQSRVVRFDEAEMAVIRAIRDDPLPEPQEVKEDEEDDEELDRPKVEVFSESYLKYVARSPPRSVTPGSSIVVDRGSMIDATGRGVTTFSILSERPGVRAIFRFTHTVGDEVVAIHPGGLVGSKDFSLTLN